ncbi:hypothetical protein D9M71_312310 [compost metagenome]
MADGELAHGAGAQADTPQAQFVLAADGLHRIAHDVQHGLNHLFAIDQDVGDAWIVVAHQGDAALAFSLHQMADTLKHFMDIAHGQRRQFVGAEHAIHQITQAVGFFDDDVGVVAQALFRQFPGQQLCRAANPAQGVLDFMGKAAHQHLAGFLFRQLCFFLGDPQQAVTGVDFEQQHRVAVAQNRCYRVVDGQGLAGEGGEHGFALGERVRLFDGLAQRVQRFGRFGKQLTDELPMAALTADGQQHLRRRVHVLEAQFGVEQDGGSGEVVE